MNKSTFFKKKIKAQSRKIQYLKGGRGLLN